MDIKMTNDLSPKPESLLKPINPKKAGKNRVYRFSVQILSILAAIVLWFYVMGVNSPSYEKEFIDVPVTIIGGDVLKENHGFTVLSGTDIKVDITIKGRKSDISKLRTLDLQIQADVSAIDTVGENTCSLNAVLPSGLTLVSMSATDVRIYIDRSISKSVPVKVTHTGYTTGLILGVFEASPSSALVEGPENVVNEIDGAYADMKLDRIDGSVTSREKLVLKNKNGEVINNPYVNLRTKEADIYIPVYQEKTIALKVNFVDNVYPLEKAKVIINPSTITIRGVVEKMPQITEIVFDIHESQIDGIYEITRLISLPVGIENKSNINSALIKISMPDINSSTVRLENIEYRNKPDGLEYSVTPNSSMIDVKIKGETKNLLDFDPEKDLTAYVNLAELEGKSAGTYQLPIIIDTNTAYTGVYPFGKHYVDITITD